MIFVFGLTAAASTLLMLELELERRGPTAKAIKAIFMISVLDFQFQTVTKKIKIKSKRSGTLCFAWCVGVDVDLIERGYQKVRLSKIVIVMWELKKETSTLFVC